VAAAFAFVEFVTDGLDALMLGKARAVLQRCIPHRTGVDGKVRVASGEYRARRAAYED
jgi:hypothetical protein